MRHLDIPALFHTVFYWSYISSTVRDDMTSTSYLLLIWQLIPHAGQESCEFAVRKVWTLLLQFRTLLLREDEHG